MGIDAGAPGGLIPAAPEAASWLQREPRNLRRTSATVLDPRMGICVCDGEGRVVAVSRSLVRLLRRSTAEIVGSPLQTFLHPDDRPAGLSSYFEAVADAVGSRNGRTTVRCLTGLDDVVLVEVAWTISETGDDCAPLGVFYLTTGAAPPPRWSVRPDANPDRPA